VVVVSGLAEKGFVADLALTITKNTPTYVSQRSFAFQVYNLRGFTAYCGVLIARFGQQQPGTTFLGGRCCAFVGYTTQKKGKKKKKKEEE